MKPNQTDLNELRASIKNATPQEIEYLKFRNPVFKEFIIKNKSCSDDTLIKTYDLISLKSMFPILRRIRYEDYIH